MSGRVVSTVFESDLPAWLKRYAAALATFAADDGSQVYPTIARLARMVGRSKRSTQRAVHDLIRRGILIVDTPPTPRRAARYHLRAVALPQIGDPDQLALFPQGGVQTSGRKPSVVDVFHSHAQVLTRHPCHPRGDTRVTRSVSDPSFSTNQEKSAREKKTGTRHHG